MRITFFLLCAWTGWAQTQFPIHRIDASGVKRLSVPAVVAASGLKVNQLAANADFIKACDNIVNSGFFSACSFQYNPLTVGGASGYDLKFTVEEVAETQNAVLDISGVAEADLWAKLAEQSPLLQRQVPATTAATARYVAALEELVKPRKIQAKMEGGLGAPLVLVFQPTDLLKLTSVAFKGNAAISSDRLNKAIAPALGVEFTERVLLQLLDLNVRPVYEEAGHLETKFTIAKLAGTSANVEIVEGPAYTLRSVQPSTGAPFPIGKLANWRKVADAIDTIRTQFKSEGYLGPTIEETRSFAEGKWVDLTLTLSKGKLYTFGRLTLSGLDRDLEALATRQWKLKAGDPMNEPYVHSYLKDLVRSPDVAARKFVFTSTLQPDPGRPGVVDVVLSFR